MRYAISFILLTTCFMFSACECGTITCPGLEPYYESFIPNEMNEVIKFRNNSGAEIEFKFYQQTVSSSRIIDCAKNSGFPGCHCKDCPDTRAQLTAFTKDTSRTIYRLLNYSIDNRTNSQDSVYLFYTIFDSFWSPFASLDHIWYILIICADFNLRGGCFGTEIIQRCTKWSQIEVHGLKIWPIFAKVKCAPFSVRTNVGKW